MFAAAAVCGPFSEVQSIHSKRAEAEFIQKTHKGTHSFFNTPQPPVYKAARSARPAPTHPCPCSRCHGAETTYNHNTTLRIDPSVTSNGGLLV